MLYRGELERAAEHAAQLAHEGRSIGDTSALVRGLIGGSLARTYGGHEFAGGDVSEALGKVVVAAPSDHGWIAYCRAEAIASSDPVEAIREYRRATGLAESVGAEFLLSVSRVSLAAALARSDDLDDAADGFRTMLSAFRRTGNLTHAITALRNLAVFLVRVGDDRTAMEILGALSSDELKSTFGAEAVDVDACRAEVVDRVGVAVVDRWMAAGHGQGTHDAIGAALAALERLTPTVARCSEWFRCQAATHCVGGSQCQLKETSRWPAPGGLSLDRGTNRGMEETTVDTQDRTVGIIDRDAGGVAARDLGDHCDARIDMVLRASAASALPLLRRPPTQRRSDGSSPATPVLPTLTPGLSGSTARTTETRPVLPAATTEAMPSPVLPQRSPVTVIEHRTALVSDEPAVTESEPLLALGAPSAGWLIGRAMFVAAFAGLARAVDEMTGRSATMSRIGVDSPALAVAVAIGVVGAAWWSATLTVDGRRLGLSTIRPGAMAAFWLLPVAWVGIGTMLMRVDARAEIDPMPMVAACGFAMSMAVPFGAVASVLRAFSHRRPATGWLWMIYVIDVISFGLAWNVLMSASSLGSSRPWAGEWRTWSVQLAAIASLIAGLMAVAVAWRAPGIVRHRVAVLDQRSVRSDRPAWFRSGWTGGRPGATNDHRLSAFANSSWRRIATMSQFGCGVLALVAILSAPGGGWHRGHGGRLALAVWAMAAFRAVSFGTWSAVAIANARRSWRKSASPSLPLVLALPMPLTLLLAGLVGGEYGWLIATGGIVVAQLAFGLSIRVVGSVLVQAGGSAEAFRSWFVTFGLAAALGLCAWVMAGPWGGAVHAGRPAQVLAIMSAVAAMAVALPAGTAMRVYDEYVRRARSRFEPST